MPRVKKVSVSIALDNGVNIKGGVDAKNTPMKEMDLTEAIRQSVFVVSQIEDLIVRELSLQTAMFDDQPAEGQEAIGAEDTPTSEQIVDAAQAS